MAKGKKSEEQEKVRLQTLLNRIESAEKFYENSYKKRFERYYKRYRNIVDALTDEKGNLIKDRSNISIPQPYTQIETILPRLVESLFASRPYVTLNGVPKDIVEWKKYKDLEEKPWDIAASSMQKLLDYQHNIPMDLQDLFHVGLKTMSLYGTTVAYVGWKYDERKVIRKALVPVKIALPDPDTGEEIEQELVDPMTGEPVTQLEAQEGLETVYDDNEVKFLDLGNFFVDQDAEDVDDARFCGHKCFMTKEELNSLSEQGALDKIDWKKVEKVDKRNNARDDRMNIAGLVTGSENRTQNAEDAQYEVHYYYEDDTCAVIINRSYIAKDGDNPFWHKKKPYVKDVYSKVPGEFYGIGVIEMIEDLHDELNVERNQRIDYRSMSLRRQFTQIRGAQISPANWEYKQFGRILVEDHNDIKQLEVPQIGNDSFNQESVIKQDMKDTTGAQDVVSGMGGGKTATETMAIDNNSSMRFKLIISSVEKRLLVGISRLMIANNQQFIDSERVLDISNDEGMEFAEITPEDIQGEFRLIASGSSVEPMANKEAFKQRMTELFSIASKDPFYMQFPDLRRALLKKVFEAYDIKDTDNLLPSDDDMNGVMQQQVIEQFIGSLPPELQQLLSMSQGQPQTPPEGSQDVDQMGGGANTAMQSERGLQLEGGGVR